MDFKRVLIVDDEEDLTWSISKHLTKDKDKYELIAVNSAIEALKILEKLPVELVISDIRMPEMSGLDLLLEIRQTYPATKVIIMTAYGSHEIQQQANERGCFKYIEKPFEIQELRQMILNIVEENRGFVGKISDLNLSDLIQMNCLGRLTNALHVKKDAHVGVIYFEDGNIVHAEVGDLKGEEAFYQILSWEGGSFSIEKGVKASEETVVKGWQTDEYQIKNITPIISTFRDQLKDLSEKIKMVNTTSVTIELKKGILYLNFLTDRSEYLIVLADADTKLGLLHMECKKVIKSMTEVL
ncbi:MAG: response regulator [Calditrichaceae bacterium]